MPNNNDVALIVPGKLQLYAPCLIEEARFRCGEEYNSGSAARNRDETAILDLYIGRAVVQHVGPSVAREDLFRQRYLFEWRRNRDGLSMYDCSQSGCDISHDRAVQVCQDYYRETFLRIVGHIGVEADVVTVMFDHQMVVNAAYM